MGISLSLTESQTLTALRSFLLAILPAGIEVVDGQDNRVAEPVGPDFVEMTPMFRERIETNTATYSDCAFIGSISGATLTVTNVSLGVIALGNSVFGTGVATGTTVAAFGSGTGGVGTYTVSPVQTVASQTMAAGVKNILSPFKVTVQLDVHGPNSGDNAQTIASLFFDDYAAQAFAASGFDVAPLYANDPHQMPFINGEQQYEQRWVIDLAMQCNPVVTVPQQFSDGLQASVKEVQAQFPA